MKLTKSLSAISIGISVVYISLFFLILFNQSTVKDLLNYAGNVDVFPVSYIISACISTIAVISCASVLMFAQKSKSICAEIISLIVICILFIGPFNKIISFFERYPYMTMGDEYVASFAALSNVLSAIGIMVQVAYVLFIIAAAVSMGAKLAARKN